ncbi:MAG: DUF4232 domain-containing protein [Candidatus Dormibacteria bacterium]
MLTALAMVTATTTVLVTGCGPHSTSVVPGTPAASPSASRTPGTPSPVSPPTPTAFVPWQPLTAQGVYPQAPVVTPSPPLAVPAGTPACQASQLEGIEAPGGAATGNVSERILLRNLSDTACYLEGYADVSILDSSGRVLASAVGSADRGTFFDLSLQVVPILMEPGTPELSPSEMVGVSGLGQAFVNVTWYECHPAVQAAQAALHLPNAGGRLLVSFAIQSPYSPACDATATTFVALSRGPIDAAGYLSQPAPVYIEMAISIDAPPSVTAGSTLTYYVTMRNASSTTYDLSECPDYVEMLNAKQPVASYQLNCAPVATMAPGQSVTFQMQLAVPATVAAGPNTLSWALIDGRLSIPTTSTHIEIARG